jgi:hypothetical protein
MIVLVGGVELTVMEPAVEFDRTHRSLMTERLRERQEAAGNGLKN